MTMLRPSVLSFSPLSEQFDRMFQSMFEPAARVHDWAPRPFPPLNAWEDDTTITLEAELPGFKMDDLDITMTGRDLSIKGRRSIERPESAEVLLAERGQGEFSRTVRVSAPVNSDKVAASLRDGVLTIRLPKTEAAQPRRITVRATEN